MKKTYDLGAIMRRAWAIRKAAAAEAGCKVSEVIWGECIRLAWAEAEGDHAEANAATVANEWAAMGDEAQTKMMAACVRKAAKNEIGYSVEDKYLQFSEVPAFACRRPHDFDEFISETCIRVLDKLSDLDKLAAKNRKRATQGKRPVTLVSIVYNAARASIAAIYYQDTKHGAAYDFEISDDDGNAASYLETMCGDSHQDTAKTAIIRAAIREYVAGLDDIGRQVVALIMDGKTEREIGDAVGMSGPAVHKRIKKMREALEYLRAA